MNPNWNQYPSNYHQHTPGPPPPPWQPDPDRHAGWGDPRPQNNQQQFFSSPSSPFGPNTFNYPPNHTANFPPPPPRPTVQYPPPHGNSAPAGPPSQPYNTTQWGVKYNQGLNQNFQAQLQSPLDEQRPALPPRPNSAISQNAHASPPGQGWPRPTTPSQQPYPDPWSLPPAQGPPDRPPIPPPRPPAYMTQMQIPQESLPHPQYSHQPLTHHYDPQNGNSNWQLVPESQQQQQPQPILTQSHILSRPGWGAFPPPADGTVSPLEDESRKDPIDNRSHTVSPMPNQNYHSSRPSISVQASPSYADVHVSATALGPGKPSDWQHYHSSDLSDNDDEASEQTPTASSQYHNHQYVASPDMIHQQPVLGQAEQIQPPPESTSHPPPNSHSQAEDSGVEAERVRTNSRSPSIVSSYGQRPHPPRTGSSSTASSMGGLHRTGTIDSVIHAWSAPLKRKPTAQDLGLQRSGSGSNPGPYNTNGTAPAKHVETTNKQSQTDFPPIVREETKVVTQQVEIDPYNDIQDQYKATLKRFAGMLRQEAAADSDEEKFKIFQGFVIHELRLRSVLYGIETQHQESSPSPAQSENSANGRNATRRDTSSAVLAKNSAISQTTQPQTPPPTHSSIARDTSTPKEDSFVVVSTEDGIEDGDYSPGGRPRMTQKAHPPRLELSTRSPANNSVIGEETNHVPTTLSPGANAPITLEDYKMPDQHSPSNDAPMVVSSESMTQSYQPSPTMSATLNGPINFQPPRPVYTPFRYNEGLSQSPPSIKLDRSTEDYVELRQAQAAESGRMLANDLPQTPTRTPGPGHKKEASLGRREHEEAFIGLIRQQSKAIRRPPNVSDNPPQLRAGTPLRRKAETPVNNVPPLTKSVQTLRSSMPKLAATETSDLSHPKLDSIKRGAAAIRDDFSFIHATVLAWDTTNRKIRQQLEMERAARQSENEARVDELFHDNEIGYADIASLESDFKLDEAGKKYQEDNLELESFSNDVFEVVVDRMESELAELSKLQVLAGDLLDLNSQSRGNRMLLLTDSKAGAVEKVLMSDVMNMMLQLFNKIELRYLKMAEAHFELERRRKKLELSILYTNGDNNGVKAIEKEFSKAQVMQILEEARKKDERANKLIDSFDRAVVRGLAENQAWIDDMSPKLELLRDLLFGSEQNYPREQSERDDLFYGGAGVKETMGHAQSANDALIADSQQLVKLSYSADQILNEADFGMYLANEKITDSDAGRFEKLKRDKRKEDEKIREEFELRLNAVCRDPEEVNGMIREITARIGNDKEHQARIERALDEAKRRNQDDDTKP